ncbi:MAG: calcium-binding protein [Leptolyngbyaceae cyanobacterium CRU_2_3]|nr:calcium-binding protein [Leptolyngbyaceae cyanobacterium CRU_2_3]
MSEILVSPGSQTGTQFGLQIISSQSVKIITNNPGGFTGVVATSANDTVRATPTDTTPFNISTLEGNDTISGGAGADTINAGTGNDLVNGGAGNDTIDSGAGGDVIAGDLGNDQIIGGIGGDFVSGGDGNDDISGDSGNDALFGQAGDDEISGGDGNDFITGGAGNDTLSGGTGRDRLFGKAGDDVLLGDAGNDDLSGGLGNDILNPGSGRNVLRGGQDSDTFQFTRNSAKQRGSTDIIIDFSPGEDVIEIDRNLLPKSGLKPGTLSNGEFAIVSGISDRPSNARIIYDSSTGKVFYNPVEGVAISLFSMQRNLTNLQATDFTIS